MSPDFKYVRHELKDLEIKLARRGEVAWFFCVLDDINTFKGEPASWENARWTGVVEKRDGRWVVVSQHFSFASEKEKMGASSILDGAISTTGISGGKEGKEKPGGRKKYR